MAEFTTMDLAPQSTAVVRDNLPLSELPSFFGRAFEAVMRALQAQGLAPIGEPFGYYQGEPGATVDVEAGFPVPTAFKATDEVAVGSLPGGKVATTLHVGPYDTMSATYQALFGWVAASGYRPLGGMWEVYLSDPQREPNPSTWRTRIYLPVVPIEKEAAAPQAA